MGNLAENKTVFFVNITKLCNINCERCFLHSAHRKQKNMLDVEVLTRFLSHPYFNHKDLVVIWEGGEPSVVGNEPFQAYIDAVRVVRPDAKQGIVTNMFHLPEWLINIIENEFLGWCETTFALSKKATLAGSEDQYLKAFIANLKKLTDRGIECAVNVELNKEMVDAGVDKFIEIILATGQKHWDFDVSIDFPAFYKSPIFVKGYPVLPQTVSNKEVKNYIREIYMRYRDLLHDHRISIDPLNAIESGNPAVAFNAAREKDFFTINPDGTVTSDPLFSDMPETYVGNIHCDSFEKIIHHPKSALREEYEIERMQGCRTCPHFNDCRGGPSHVPVHDGSGECCGYRQVRDILHQPKTTVHG